MIQHQLPIHDYALPTDQDYNDQFPGHGNYATGGAGREGNNSLHGPTHFSFTPTNSTPAARFVSDRGVASDSSRYVFCRCFPSACASSSCPARVSSRLTLESPRVSLTAWQLAPHDPDKLELLHAHPHLDTARPRYRFG